MRRFLIVLLLTLSFTVSRSEAARDRRASFGAERASLLEAAVASLYPGGTVEWNPVLGLRQNGVTRPIAVSMAVRRDEAGFTCAATIEFPETARPIDAALSRFETTFAQSQPDVIAFKATKQFAITAASKGALGDPTAVVIRVEDIDFTALTYDNLWPEAFVAYRATYASPDWIGEIAWESKITTQPIAAAGRLPTLIIRADKDGTGHSDTAVNTAPDDTTIAISSRSSNQRITSCSDPCQPDGRTLLGLWWTTRAVVAVQP